MASFISFAAFLLCSPVVLVSALQPANAETRGPTIPLPVENYFCEGRYPTIDPKDPLQGGNLTDITQGKYPSDLMFAMDRRIVKNVYEIHVFLGEKAADQDILNYLAHYCDFLKHQPAPNSHGHFGNAWPTGQGRWRYSAEINNFLLAEIASSAKVTKVLPVTEKV